MKYAREIERKYTLTFKDRAETYMDVATFIDDMFTVEKEVTGASYDTFWEQPGVDFIRYRENTNELTVKVTDKETIEDRIEENVIVRNPLDTKRFCQLVFGVPTLKIEKVFDVFYLPNAVLSLYTVEGYDQLFLEIEAADIATVDFIEYKFNSAFELHQEMRSLYQICKEEK